MNQHQATGRWAQIKGRTKRAWGTLTGNGYKKAEGSVDQLCGVIQEKIGDSTEAINATLGNLHGEPRKEP